MKSGFIARQGDESRCTDRHLRSITQIAAITHNIDVFFISDRSIEITTGRKLAEGFPNNVYSVIVMLDANIERARNEARRANYFG
jgi:ABC-type branched-subunit amino acid transport system ATPase component